MGPAEICAHLICSCPGEHRPHKASRAALSEPQANPGLCLCSPSSRCCSNPLAQGIRDHLGWKILCDHPSVPPALPGIHHLSPGVTSSLLSPSSDVAPSLGAFSLLKPSPVFLESLLARKEKFQTHSTLLSRQGHLHHRHPWGHKALRCALVSSENRQQ